MTDAALPPSSPVAPPPLDRRVWLPSGRRDRVLFALFVLLGLVVPIGLAFWVLALF